MLGIQDPVAARGTEDSDHPLTAGQRPTSTAAEQDQPFRTRTVTPARCYAVGTLEATASRIAPPGLRGPSSLLTGSGAGSLGTPRPPRVVGCIALGSRARCDPSVLRSFRIPLYSNCRRQAGVRWRREGPLSLSLSLHSRTGVIPPLRKNRRPNQNMYMHTRIHTMTPTHLNL